MTLAEPLGRAEVVLEPADGTRLRADRPRVVKARPLLGVPRGTLTFAQCVTSRTATADPGDLSALAMRRRLEEGLCGAARGAGAKASAGLGDGRSGRGRAPPPGKHHLVRYSGGVYIYIYRNPFFTPKLVLMLEEAPDPIFNETR